MQEETHFLEMPPSRETPKRSKRARLAHRVSNRRWHSWNLESKSSKIGCIHMI